jgi:exodeoxyribonuclease VII large subunit
MAFCFMRGDQNRLEPARQILYFNENLCSSFAMTDIPAHLSLSQYLDQVKAIVNANFSRAVWVKAEIRSMSSKGGHYYFELAEKDQQTDQTIASCRAAIWKFNAHKIIGQFELDSGIKLDKDLNVLVKVKATFSPQYGFSIIIESFDASFSLGDIAHKYQQIVRQLTDEGLIGLNQVLPTPFDIQHVLVISPENAAGLGDFKKDADILHQHGVCHFVYSHATFQGSKAPTEISAALSIGLREWAIRHDFAPDLIVIIRGGGAVNDLAYLNDYQLAALLCKRTVPIWVGIGHERDRTILDEVAHRSFDTPSKVIAGIRNHIAENTSAAADYFYLINTIGQYQMNAYMADNSQLMALIQTNAVNMLQNARKEIDESLRRGRYYAERQVQQAMQQTEQLMRETLIQSPTNTLQRGYAIVRVAGSPAKSIAALAGQCVEIEMKDGTATATVNKVIHHD